MRCETCGDRITWGEHPMCDSVRLVMRETPSGSWPQTGDIIIDHQRGEAYVVMPDTASGDGCITTHSPGEPNTCLIRAQEVEYETWVGKADWEVKIEAVR